MSEIATPTASSAPSSTPAAAPTPAMPAQPSTPAPAQAAGEKPGAPFNSAFDEIDKIIADTQQKTPKAPGARRAEKNAGQPDTEGDPTKPEQKNGEQGKPEAEKKPAGEFDESKAGPKELKAAYRQRQTELKEAREKLTAMETRLAELQAKEVELAEAVKLKERYSELEKRSQELDTELKFANYERSSEYKEKYLDPFVNAYGAAQKKMEQLRVVERKNPETEEVVQQARKATREDFDAIMGIRDDGDAAVMAERLFGPMANLVMYHREKIQDLNSARINAIDEYRKKGSERETKMAEQSKAHKERLTTVFNEAKKVGIEKHPQWFKPDDGDDQGKEILAKGMQDADVNFSGEAKLDPAERAMRHAAMRNMAGAFPYVALKLHRATQKIAELEAELKDFKASEPTERGSERGTPAAPLGWEQELEALDKGGRR